MKLFLLPLRYSGFACLILLTVSLFSISVAPSVANAQTDPEDKRPLDHEDYEKWNSVRGQNLSDDGKWVTYSVGPERGDATLYIRQISSDKEFSVLRGRSARFTYDSKYVLYIVAPDSKVIEKLRKAKTPGGQLPSSRLQILNLETGKHVTISDVNSFTLPSKASGWVAFKVQEPTDDKDAVTESKSKLTTTYEVTEEGVKRKEKKKEAKKKKAKKTASEKEKKSEKKKGNSASKKKALEKKRSKSSGENTEKKNDTEKKGSSKKKKKNGTTLVLKNLDTRFEQRIPFVTNYRFSEDGTHFAYATSDDTEYEVKSDSKKKKDDKTKAKKAKGGGDGVHVIDLEKMKTQTLVTGLGNYGQVVFSKDAKQIAFLTDRDDYETEKSFWSMYHWRSGQKEAKKVVDSEADAMPEGWWIADTSAPLFSENGKRIFFNTKPKPEDEEKKKKEDEDKPKVPKLDIWHWQDPYLQPQQLLQVQQERNRSYRALYDVKSKKMIQVATKEIPRVSIDPRNESDVVFGSAPDKYNKMLSWDVQGFSDWYLIDLKTGESKLIREMNRGGASLSPSGKYITWWDGEKKTWFAQSLEMKKGSDKLAEPVDLKRGVKHAVHNELHDTPSLPGPYGSAGWLAEDAGMLIYDRWDIWQVDPSGKADPVCLTGGKGRKEKIRFRNVRLDPELRTIDLSQPQVLSALIHSTKASGYFRMTQVTDDKDEKAAKDKKKKTSAKDKKAKAAVATYKVEKLIQLDENVGGLRKARDSNSVLITRSTFQRSPDVWASDLEFKTMRRISRANPQQENYLWGSAELVHWDAEDGQPLDGILYKPENFDPTEKYPLMVYFYERNSDNLHRYYNPAAGRSIINFSFYVSRGYVVFVPDIPYKTGEPGPSAANAILPGVKSIVDQGFVDDKRIGMQGHSWGGYQTAYLVTMTDMFCCAESGAPVSNMTSAYGGIRWGTGMSRMFQYEKTQSRIGGTLWEEREKYIANSPVFFADKINTPLLILHNDEDTAVPWYQGIELFVAMRRLEKPSWMLNYNGDPHWVMSDENRMDFAKRMQQFFDHYMKGDPMPVWMADGIPAVDKGKEMGFEYAEVEEANEEESAKEKEEEGEEEEGEEEEDGSDE